MKSSKADPRNPILEECRVKLRRNILLKREHKIRHVKQIEKWTDIRSEKKKGRQGEPMLSDTFFYVRNKGEKKARGTLDKGCIGPRAAGLESFSKIAC